MASPEAFIFHTYPHIFTSGLSSLFPIDFSLTNLITYIRIPEFKKIEELALLLHSKIEHIHIIGWNLALDHNNDAVLIEANATWPGITIEQLCTGPIFGDRTQEVIEYCKSKCGIPLF
ncbi:MAG: hypothetical protein K2G77_07120 [Muribaculaceae bacterium]|nr:hypothetical protein [Muribaculaceae bacterium]